MISLIKIVNTICFIIVLSNPVVYDTLFNSFYKIYNFHLGCCYVCNIYKFDSIQDM